MSTLIFMLAVVAAGNNEAAVDFDNEIIPIFTKAGCNTGACHGAAVGRGGFKLSLYGGDPEHDFRSVVFELEGRRVNLAQPDQSLVLLKPTESVAHEGGYRLEDDGEGAALLKRWIEQGAVRSLDRQRLATLEVTPKSQVVKRVGQSLRLRASARFQDGSVSDVTKWTVFTAEDPTAVEIDSVTADAKVLRRGRHVIIARYLDRVVPLELMLPLTDQPVNLAEAPRRNFIDDEILKTLETLRIPLSPQADDSVFLRRVTLDLTGRLPALEEVIAFLSDPNPDKRIARINQLLDSGEFNEYWTMQFAKLLRVRSQPQDTQGPRTYHRWIMQQISLGIPYDDMAREILVSVGDTHDVGPANFYRTASGPREQAEFASELFMGSRLRCANCHNHPLDRWTQDDYHGLAAIFAKLQRGRVIGLAARGEVTHPRTGDAALPRIPGGPFLELDGDGRQAFATWLTGQENPYFSKAIVNRLWKSMMGRGLVEPTDDFRDTNPATHPRLLDRLAEDFVAHDYDLRHTLREIALSAAYARSATTHDANAADDRFYSRALVRPLESEVLADAISDVVGTPDQYGKEPIGTRAVALFDSNIASDALDILGRCSREESCETATAPAGGLPRKLHMFNGSLLNRRLKGSRGRLPDLIEAGKPASEVVGQLYLTALARHPSAEEAEFWAGQVAVAKTPQEQKEILEDFLWSLLTCREFVTNH